MKTSSYHTSAKRNHTVTLLQEVVESTLISRILQIRFLHFHQNLHFFLQKNFQLIIFKTFGICVENLVFRQKNDFHQIFRHRIFRHRIFRHRIFRHRISRYRISTARRTARSILNVRFMSDKHLSFTSKQIYMIFVYEKAFPAILSNGKFINEIRSTTSSWISWKVIVTTTNYEFKISISSKIETSQ